MKLLQAVVAVLTVLLFLVRQNVFAGVCPVKTRSLAGYCDSFYHDHHVSSTSAHSSRMVCARARSHTANLSLPKHKKDPKIRVDNEDIDYPPVE